MAWLAGLLEGEGCFSTTRSHGRCYARIEVGSVDRDVIEHVARIVGHGCVGGENHNRTSTGKILYRWESSGTLARSLMHKLHPLMSERRQARIREVLLIDGRKPL